MRQLQGPLGPLGKVTGVAPISQGGTGGTTPYDATVNLNGVSVSKFNQPNGPVQADEKGLFPIGLLTAAGLAIGYTLDGPTNLVNGQTSVFRLTNWSNTANVAVGISAGSVTLTNDELTVLAPATGTSVTLSLGDRQVILPVITAGSQIPVIVSPEANSENPAQVTFKTAPFSVAAETYSGWTAISTTGTTSVSIPSNAIGVEIEGRRGDAGAAYLTLSGNNYQLGVSTTRRRIDFVGQATLSILVNGTGSLKYRWVVSSATHTATDWEVSTDPSFSSLVTQSLNDTVNKTEWSTALALGSYYVRVRFYATLAV